MGLVSLETENMRIGAGAHEFDLVGAAIDIVERGTEAELAAAVERHDMLDAGAGQGDALFGLLGRRGIAEIEKLLDANVLVGVRVEPGNGCLIDREAAFVAAHAIVGQEARIGEDRA